MSDLQNEITAQINKMKNKDEQEARRAKHDEEARLKKDEQDKKAEQDKNEREDLNDHLMAALRRNRAFIADDDNDEFEEKPQEEKTTTIPVNEEKTHQSKTTNVNEEKLQPTKIAPTPIDTEAFLQQIRQGVKLKPTTPVSKQPQDDGLQSLRRSADKLAQSQKSVQQADELNQDWVEPKQPGPELISAPKVKATPTELVKPAPAMTTQLNKEPELVAAPKVKATPTELVKPAPVMTTQLNKEPELVAAPKMTITPVELVAPAKTIENTAVAQKSNIADKVNLFEKQKVHPYNQVGGSLADTSGENRYVPPAPIAPKVTPKPVVNKKVDAPVQAIKQPKPAAKAVQSHSEADDYEFARQLQKQFDEEDKKSQRNNIAQQIEDDHLLAAKLQVKELVNDAIIPGANKLDRNTLKDLAADIQQRGFDDLRKSRQQQPVEYLSEYSMTIYVQTYSLRMAMIGNQLVIHEVKQAMLVHAVSRQNSVHFSMQAAHAERFGVMSFNQSAGIFNKQMHHTKHQSFAAEQERVEEVQPSMSPRRR